MERILGIALAGGRRRFLIVGKHNERDAGIAIRIDRLPERITFSKDSEAAERPTFPAVLQPFIKTCYEKDGQVWADWDVSGFFENVAAST